MVRLVHLRLTGQPPAAPVNAVRVWADDVAASCEQLALFAHKPRRDLRVADEALARLRAELGDDAVVRPVLRDGHLPEASFGWERLVHIVAARPSADRNVVRPLIRRVFTRPQQLPPQPGWSGTIASGLEHGAVVRILGPTWFPEAGGRNEVHREYLPSCVVATACGCSTTSRCRWPVTAPSSNVQWETTSRASRHDELDRRPRA